MIKANKKLLELDESLCLKVNGLSGNKVVDNILYTVSKLGDWSIYLLFLLLFIYLSNNKFVIGRDYIIAAILNMMMYKIIKNKVKRSRPFRCLDSINKIIPPPDEFSFPSGHAGGAAVFCYCTCYHMPETFAYASIIWMLLVGFSRIYNGVHFPGDVAVGYIMGGSVAKFTLSVFHNVL